LGLRRQWKSNTHRIKAPPSGYWPSCAHKEFSAHNKSGDKGVDQASVDKFFGEAEAYVAWYGEGETKKELLPLGEATVAAAAALSAVRSKIDDYFTRTRLAAFDPRAQAAVNGAEADLAAIAAAELGPTSPEVAKLPLARVECARALPLADGVNPAWSGRIATFASASVSPLVGNRDKLDENDWAAVQKSLAAHEAWSATKPASPVEKLGVGRSGRSSAATRAPSSTRSSPRTRPRRRSTRRSSTSSGSSATSAISSRS